MLLLLSSGTVSIITFSLSISFEKEFLAALTSKRPESQGFRSLINNNNKEASSRLLVSFFSVEKQQQQIASLKYSVVNFHERVED